MNIITLHYIETAASQGFSIEENQGNNGVFEPGNYFSNDYVIPEGFAVEESHGGTREFFRGDEHFAISYKRANTSAYPILTNGHEEIILKQV